MLMAGALSVLVMSSDGSPPMLQATEEIVTVAAEAGVDEQDLRGAVNTTGLEPRQYLRGVGELPTPPTAPAVAAPIASVWTRLAQCESGGNWSAVSRGGTYRGGLQFDQQTWLAYGGGVYASSAHLASQGQQVAIAEKLRAARGFAPWPVCSRVVGLR